MHASSTNIIATDDAQTDIMDVDSVVQLPAPPDGAGIDEPVLSKAEERVLVRESTAGFAGNRSISRICSLHANICLRLDYFALPTCPGTV